MTEPTHGTLLADVERYLAALHHHSAQHDRLGAGYSCAGCQLLARLTTPTVTPHGAPDAPPTPQTDTEAPDGRSSREAGAQTVGLREWAGAEELARTHLALRAAEQRAGRAEAALDRVRALATLLPPDPGGDADTAGWSDATDRTQNAITGDNPKEN